jgi:hypothetical protein
MQPNADKNKSIGFQLVLIRTDQFAIVDEYFENHKPLHINVNFKIAKNDEQKIVSVMFISRFMDVDKLIMILDCSCHFKITDESWEQFKENDSNALIIPKSFLTHLAVITVGTARGILHSKTEGTKFNGQFLPTLNLLDIFTTDTKIE